MVHQCCLYRLRYRRSVHGESKGREEPEVLRRREIVAELDAKRIDLGVRQRLVGEAFDAAIKQNYDLNLENFHNHQYPL